MMSYLKSIAAHGHHDIVVGKLMAVVLTLSVMLMVGGLSLAYVLR